MTKTQGVRASRMSTREKMCYRANTQYLLGASGKHTTTVRSIQEKQQK